MSTLSLIFETAVAVALVFAGLLSWRLDQRLTALRNGQDGVRAAVAELAEATTRAQASVAELRAMSEEAGRDLERRVAVARGLADELNLLAGAGDRAAGRERNPLTGAGDRAGGGEPVRPRPKPRRRAAAEADGPQAAELLDRLKGVR